MYSASFKYFIIYATVFGMLRFVVVVTNLSLKLLQMCEFGEGKTDLSEKLFAIPFLSMLVMQVTLDFGKTLGLCFI